MKHAATEQQKQAAAERREKFRELARRIGQMTAEQRAQFAAQAPAVVTVEGRVLSPFNQCLIVSQAPSATVIGGFRQWIKAGRCVRKGEHGLSLWIPSVRKAKEGEQGEEGDGETRFIMGTVFDVSQTEPVDAARAAPVSAPESEQQSEPAPAAAVDAAPEFSTEFTRID